MKRIKLEDLGRFKWLVTTEIITTTKRHDGSFLIEADLDVNTCVRCRRAVPVGRICGCPQRSPGPMCENPLVSLAGGKEWSPDKEAV